VYGDQASVTGKAHHTKASKTRGRQLAGLR
jgi:hypothetical protein